MQGSMPFIVTVQPVVTVNAGETETRLIRLNPLPLVFPSKLGFHQHLGDLTIVEDEHGRLQGVESESTQWVSRLLRA
jgi:hypothetical protein